jgi:hypothetical protein
MRGKNIQGNEDAHILMYTYHDAQNYYYRNLILFFSPSFSTNTTVDFFLPLQIGY